MNPETPRSIYDSAYRESLDRTFNTTLGWNQCMDDFLASDRPEFIAALLNVVNEKPGAASAVKDMLIDHAELLARFAAEKEVHPRPTYDPSKLAKTLMGIP
jgi:hypothetical protein